MTPLDTNGRRNRSRGGLASFVPPPSSLRLPSLLRLSCLPPFFRPFPHPASSVPSVSARLHRNCIRAAEAVAQVHNGIAPEVRASTLDDAKDNRQRWQDWCDAAAANGSRGLHRDIRVPDAPHPTVVRTERGHSSHPHDIVDAEVQKYEKLWDASTMANQAWIPERSALPRVEAGRLREVSIIFPHTTAASICLVRFRHFRLLDDQGLEVMAVLFEGCERLGLLPRQLCFIVMSMLPKPDQGHRLSSCTLDLIACG